MIDTLNEGVFNALIGNSALTALLSSSSAIYFGQAPLEAAKPYIVYSINSGGDDHLSPTESVDVRYTVKVVADTAQSAGAVAGAIRNALHEIEIALDSPWTCYRMQADGILMYPENIANRQFWHAGHLFRLRASQ